LLIGVLLASVVAAEPSPAPPPEPVVVPVDPDVPRADIPRAVRRYWAGRNQAFLGAGMGGLGLLASVGGFANEQPAWGVLGIFTVMGGGFVMAGGVTRSRTALVHLGVDTPNGALICGWIGAGVLPPLGYACLGAQMSVNDRAYWDGKQRPNLFSMSVGPGWVAPKTGGVVVTGTW